MKGAIVWTERKNGGQYNGVVTHCYRNGDHMYVVHICEGYGVGELAIALTGEVQTVACNYQSDDDEKPSKPLVNGRLVWQDDSAVFSGTWFDPDSENEASDVLITVDGCDLTVSVCAPESPSRLIGRHIDIVGDLIAELDTSHFTAWCGASIPPTLPGVYAVQWPADELNRPGFRRGRLV